MQLHSSASVIPGEVRLPTGNDHVACPSHLRLTWAQEATDSNPGAPTTSVVNDAAQLILPILLD